MAIFSQRERKTAEAIANIAFGNPFDEVRLAREREVLEDEFVEHGVYRYMPDAGYDAMFAIVPELHRRAEKFVHDARARLRSDHDATAADLRLYEEFSAYLENPARGLPSPFLAEHLFAACFQVARAFHAIFEYIVGSSTAT